MQRSDRFLGIAGFALVIGFTSAKDADACSCSGWAGLEQNATMSDVVFVGRVVSNNPDPGQGVAYIEVKVKESLAGPSKGLRVRVWDRAWNTTCSAELSQFPNGAIVALALRRNKQEYRMDPQGLTIKTGDFLVGPCAEYGRVMASLEEGQGFLARVRKGAKRGK